MTTSPSLLALTRALATDDETKAAYREDPEGFLRARGHGDLEPAQFATALEHVADALPTPLAVALTTVGDAGAGLGDLLAGVAGIDPDEADVRWAALRGTVDDADPIDGLDGPDEQGDSEPDMTDQPDDLGDDPADLDDEPGGFDRATDPDDPQDGRDTPGGFDRVGGGDTTFGGGIRDDQGRGEDPERPGGFDPVTEPEAGNDVEPDEVPAWETDLEPLGGFDLVPPPDVVEADDPPGGFDDVD